MAYSASLALRIRQFVAGRSGVIEKKMFGGIGFLVNGNMLVGIWKNLLIARIGPEAAESALKEPNIVEFDITGKPMKGWVMVEPDGIETDEQLRVWIQRSLEFVSKLPKK